jgi:excinuclease ABC subunit A
MQTRNLILKGVRQNNLKNIDLELPLGKAIIVTGPSGSGKSSLAFETIYAEGQRRYMQSLSTYARQFLERFKAPLVDKIENIPPTIALEQINPVRNSRATVGTTTEIFDYLRLLFEKTGVEYCAKCDLPKKRMTFEEIFENWLAEYKGKTTILCATPHLELDSLLKSGYTRILKDGEIFHIEEYLKTHAKKKKSKEPICVVIDRLKAEPENQNRFSEALSTAQSMSGEGFVYTEANGKYEKSNSYTTQSRCPKCHELSTPKSAISFSFNSPLGACSNCKGFGNTLEVDEDLVVPDPRRSLGRGAIDPFTKPSLRHWHKKMMEFCEKAKIDTSLSYHELPQKHRDLIFNGDKKFRGVRGVFKKMEEDRYKMRIRVFISRYVSPFTCEVCKGARLNPDTLRVKVSGLNIAQVSELTLGECHNYFNNLKLSPREKETSKDILKQIDRRLDYLNTVGLNYLTLSRLTRSLSGGEYQRILLGTQLSQGLTDTLYVLDEPSIGLHPKDTGQLLKVLKRLRELGNSLVMVEHDPEMIQWGEYVVDVGPGSGSRGGTIVFQGTREHFLLSDGKTSKAIRDWKEDCRHALLKPTRDHFEDTLEIKGAAGNNLKNIDVNIPLKALVTVTGVSGSGKSTLIVDTLYNALAKVFHGKSDKIGKFAAISGVDQLGGVELVDQSPIGRSSRSNPITFVKGYDEVRSLFAHTPEATARRFTPGHFSFNVKGGRCESCEGEGRVKVDMVFLDDVWVPCQTCDEKRFKPSVLAVRYRGKNIDDVLKMSIEEAYDFFKGSSALRAKLGLLNEVGLGYLQLGQPGFTLSGGEAQRLKIARELTLATSRKAHTLFILDEPTTGLHFNEITRLISVLRRLIHGGHSVVVIEHNLQLICHSDFLIDLGPDGGAGGGSVIAMGTPRQLAQKKFPHTGLYLADILYQ